MTSSAKYADILLPGLHCFRTDGLCTGCILRQYVLRYFQ
ncbi:hypothetical protein MJK70_09275 [Klebsiella pneumoniae]|nr:hypothetical protein MJK70_09275 [Klebsiella pneumoniae]